MADQVTRDIIVKANVDEAYRLWSNFENFPHFMKYISSITKTGDRTSHWVMAGPLFQPIRGVIFALAFYPLRSVLFAEKRG